MAAAKKAAPRAAAKTEETVAEAPFAAAGAWSDAAKDQYETALKAFNDGAEKFRVDAEEALASTREGFEAAGERMRSVNADMLAAAREEMTDAVEFANELARAKSLGDALEIQKEYWTGLFAARSERARAFTEASVEATREAFEPMTKSYTAAFSFAPAFDKFFPFAGK
ncbi:MAG: phasin family protein [Parvularculaceae bacterium]